MKRVVLIVDDDEQFLSSLARSLKRGGFSVLTASDGCDVDAALDKHRVDLVLLDLHMPGMNGWEVMRRLREPPIGVSAGPRPTPKVVIVSGRSEDDAERFARRLGAAAYLRKPIWGRQVLSAVRDVLAH